MSSFEEMAKKREIEASKLTDMDIWKTVISKVVELPDTPLDIKVDILIQSVPDIGVIFGQLKYQNSIGKVNDKDYHDMLEICISKLEKKKELVDFDPRTYTESK